MTKIVALEFDAARRLFNAVSVVFQVTCRNGGYLLDRRYRQF